MQTLKQLGLYFIYATAVLAMGITAAEPPGWWNFAALGYLGFLVWLAYKYEPADDDPDDAEENDEDSEAPAPHQAVDGNTHWVQCLVHEDDNLPEGVHRLPEPT